MHVRQSLSMLSLDDSIVTGQPRTTPKPGNLPQRTPDKCSVLVLDEAGVNITATSHEMTLLGQSMLVIDGEIDLEVA